MDPFPFIMFGILALGSAVVVATNPALPLVPAGLFFCAVLAIAVVAYVDGPAAYVAVEPGRVVVGNWLRRYTVPRSRIADVGTLEHLALYLVLDDGKKIRLRVFDPAMRGTTYRSPRQGAARARAITDAIENGPAGDGSGAVTRRLRWLNVTLICLPFAAAAALLLAARA